MAINGLKSALQQANGKLSSNDITIAVLVAQRDANEARAVNAEALNKPLVDKLARYEGRTWAGKKLRQAGTGLKYVGGVTLAILAIKVAT
ncbi:hypothetical protein [Spirosoma linguale]|uniref:Uncharacterized protein n=1 Tax=Spirosoma linguale (strain ATCC 33905 / DSM 74 / LMG 10896 / Claus 1) TaxID=504472 RepID=D2QEV2_SPILD|nr:hypothetical protein Slin_5327 [Spirosoma linguale DSM 74]